MMDKMIPKIIHYCWFGRGAKPASFQRYLDSWKRHLPEYQIIEWNEDNFDIGKSLPYVRDAYAHRKYAFVSDYVRLHALRTMGGIYMDTDVEVLKSYNPLLGYSSFWGFEDDQFMASCVIGAQKDDPVLERFLHHYDHARFVRADGTLDQTTNTYVLSEMLGKMGAQMNGRRQVILENIAIFPKSYFSPYDYKYGGNDISEESYAIHHFAQTWLPWHVRYRRILKTKMMQGIGRKRVEWIIGLLRRP